MFLLSLALPSVAQVPGGRLVDAEIPDTPRPTPRLANGLPDLGNSKGVWNPATVANLAGTGRQGPRRSPVAKRFVPPFLPWAKEAFEKAQATLSKEDPEARCLPPGIPRMYATPFPFQIYQMPDRVLFIFEGGAHIWRVVYTDGRPHPEDPNPTYLGDAIGHWEDDTLVVDTVGFNDRTWLDQDGTPHSPKLHVVEYFTRVNEHTLHYEFTIDDPGAYSEPWGNSFDIPWVPDAELLEYICQENNADVEHLVGK